MKYKSFILFFSALIFLLINGCINTERIQPTTPSDTSAPSHLATVVADSIFSGPDTYEYDDNYYNSSYIAVNGSSQRHAAHQSCDEDWIQFYASAGTQYTIETYGLGYNADTYLMLSYPTTTIIYSDNDGGSEPYASKIVFVPSTSGDYYINAVMYYCTSGEGTDFYVRVTSP